ncbi:MAG: GNAT family N-acetyltransferase [Clostridium sp.]
MLEFNTIKLKDIPFVKSILFSEDAEKANFYSTKKKSITYFTLLKGVYFTLKDGKKVGILVIDSSVKEFYFYPIYPETQNIDLLEFIDSLDERFDLTEYTFGFNCNNLDCLLGSEEEYEMISTIKFMKCNLSSFASEVKYKSFEDKGLLIRRYVLKKDEEIRVKIQNEIFNSVKGRSQLTVQDVLMEEYSPKFIEDLCFILEEDGEAIGYGQIININGSYFLVNFGIVPSARKKGYARNFLTYIMLIAYKNGIGSLELTVDNTNIPAVNLYATQGFEEVKNVIKIQL